MKKIILFVFAVLCIATTDCDSRSRRGENQYGTNEESVAAQLTNTEEGFIPCEKPKVNIYIENSGSMDGFVNGITNFKDAIGKVLAKLKYYYDEENVEIFFIRNDRAVSGNQTEKINVVKACESNISDFATAIDIKWRDDMGKRGQNTNLNNIFKEILDRTDENTISILFSDCIYSIGKGGAENLLNHEKGTTYDAFLSYAKKNKGCLATSIIKMKSTFDGKYYPYTGDGDAFKYKGELPYYICVLANQNLLTDFNRNIKLGKGDLKGYDNKYIISKGASDNLYYSVLMATDNKGRFKQQRQYASSEYVHGIQVIDTKPNKRTGDSFTFAIAADMKGIDAEEDYILNPKNYELTDNCFSVVEVKKLEKNEINQSDWLRISKRNPTHIVIIEVNDMQWTNLELSIALKKQVPQWIEQSSILDDTKADYLQDGKSFGLKYWIYGIAEAYEELYPEDRNFFNITINIKK